MTANPARVQLITQKYMFKYQISTSTVDRSC